MTSPQHLSFFFARLAIGTSMFGHGLVRLPKLQGFSNWMIAQFGKSILPQIIVVPFSYGLPVAEFLVGLLLLIGLFTRQALIAGAVVMIALIFGSSTIEEWGAIPTQLIHAAFFTILLCFEKSYNYLAIDSILRQNKQSKI